MRSLSMFSVIPAASTCYPRRCGGARSHSCCCRGFAVGRAAPRVMALANCSAAWRAAARVASRFHAGSERIRGAVAAAALRRQRSQKPVNGIRANSSMCLWLDGRLAPIGRPGGGPSLVNAAHQLATHPGLPCGVRSCVWRERCQWPSPARNLSLFRHQDMCVWPAATDCPGSGRLRGERPPHQSADGAISFDFDVTVEIGFKEADIAEQYRPALCRRRAEDKS